MNWSESFDAIPQDDTYQYMKRRMLMREQISRMEVDFEERSPENLDMFVEVLDEQCRENQYILSSEDWEDVIALDADTDFRMSAIWDFRNVENEFHDMAHMMYQAEQTYVTVDELLEDGARLSTDRQQTTGVNFQKTIDEEDEMDEEDELALDDEYKERGIPAADVRAVTGREVPVDLRQFLRAEPDEDIERYEDMSFDLMPDDGKNDAPRFTGESVERDDDRSVPLFELDEADPRDWRKTLDAAGGLYSSRDLMNETFPEGGEQRIVPDQPHDEAQYQADMAADAEQKRKDREATTRFSRSTFERKSDDGPEL